MESIKIDEQGRITRSKRKVRHRKINKKERELKQFTRKHLKNLTKSEKHYDHGVFKNARIMGKPKDKFIPQSEMEVHKGGVVYPYDKRCHPYISPKAR